MNMQCGLIPEITYYEFELGPNILDATQNISVKEEGAEDLSTVTRWFKKFCSGCKNLDDQAKSARPKTEDTKVNPASSTWRVSGELGISQTSVVCNFHNLSRKIQSC